jgi:glyoxylase-like metal-dependent hydrolase (beta-lactamase superfamily II)
MRNALLAAVLALPTLAAAQTPAPAPPQPLKIEQLRPTVAMLVGPGGNITMGYGPGTVVLVDDQVAEVSARVLATVRAIDPRPVSTVINTHWHFDHAGGNEALAATGAVIVAHANVKARMAAGGTIVLGARTNTYPPAPPSALPKRTYETTLTLDAGGDRLRLVHMPNAHTDGDTMVKWTKANVLDMGDVYVRYGLPFIDTRAGGTLRGMIRCVDAGLALADDQTIIVPGHGEPATKKDLAAYRDALAQIADAVDAAVKAGKSLAEVQALKPADSFHQPTNAFLTTDQFVAAAYETARAAH